MLRPCLALILLALALSWPLTLFMRHLGRRLGALDAPGVPGQIKVAARRVPNTGGIAVFLGIALPMLAAIVTLTAGTAAPIRDLLLDQFPLLRPHLAGVASQAPAAFALLSALLILHLMGLIDDRRPLGAYPKLALMLALAAGMVLANGDSRLLTLLDSQVGGPWLSILITVLWLVVVTNAFNFLDNMDGLSAGVAAIAASFFLIATLINGQWFIAACLALLIGSLLGFLCFNFPLRTGRGATIFMGDGGSLVVGFLLAFLTVRTTYIAPAPTDPAAGAAGTSAGGGGWYGVFMPLVVLAIPLYDFCSVTVIRLFQGKSPFVGDLQHFSHRLVRHGLSKRAAVLVIYGCTAVTAIGGVSLASLQPWQAALVGLQTILVLLVLGLYEWSRLPGPPPPPNGPAS